MQSAFAWDAFTGALAGSAVACTLTLILLRAWLARRLHGLDAQRAVAAEDDATDGGLSDVATELVQLVRGAADSAIRNEEVHEWHRPSLESLGEDDVSAAIRARLRRARFDAVAARAALHAALRRHRAALPATLDEELRAFCERLGDENGGSPAQRKRRLAQDLDAVEARLRDALGAELAP